MAKVAIRNFTTKNFLKMEKKLESMEGEKFSHLEIEKMKRIKGGYTLNTVTVYSSGTVSNDGTASADEVTGD